jgi:predicted ATPase
MRRRVVLTGGPGAGKTAVLEMIRQSFCAHVKVLSEAAGVVFGGGFPREDDPACRRAAQRAIFHVQRELEAAGDSHSPAIVLCDRGTLDGLAYWPGSVDEFCSSVRTAVSEELARYDAVIHLRTPTPEYGYNHQNPLRTESAAAAADIDARILRAWELHPRRFIVEPSASFLEKVRRALTILRTEMPDCCKAHIVPALDDPSVPAVRHDAEHPMGLTRINVGAPKSPGTRGLPAPVME